MRTLNLCFVLLLITLASSQSFQLQGKESKPPQPSTPKIPKEFEQFEPLPRDAFDLDILGPRFSCCNYHWTFAVDNSASMSGLPLLRVYFLFWYIRNYFTFSSCNDQRISMFGFNTFINPPSLYYEFYTILATSPGWSPNPPQSSAEPANFAFAIISMINTVYNIFQNHSSNHHHCLILITDGQAPPVPNFLVPMYQAVK